MKEIKDLMLIDLNEENEKEKIENKKTDRVEMKKISNKQAIMDDDIIINQKQEEPLVKEECQKKDNRKFRKYFKYQDGKIKYMSIFNKEDFRKEKLSLKKIKKNIKDEITVEKKRIDKKGLINSLFIIFVVFTMIFTYVYYFRNNSDETDKSNNQGIIMNKDAKDKTNSDVNVSNVDVNVKASLEGEMTLNELIKAVKAENNKELTKINDYLNLKGNKVSTEGSIKLSKKEKENLYGILYLNKEKIDEVIYDETEELIVKSIAMSEEFLKLFKESGKKSDFENIINKYK